MWDTYKAQAKQIYFANVKTFLLFSAAITITNAVVDVIPGPSGSMISSFVSSVLNALKCYFFFRAIHSGTPDIKGSLKYFFQRQNFLKVLNIGIVLILMSFLPLLIGLFFPSPAIIYILFFVSVVINFYFSLVYYLYAANSDQPVSAYFKASFAFIKGHVIDFIVISLAVSILPAILCMAASFGISTLFFQGNIAVYDFMAQVFMIPFNPYIALTVAAFVSSLIPEGWFSGEITFS